MLVGDGLRAQPQLGEGSGGPGARLRLLSGCGGHGQRGPVLGQGWLEHTLCL